MCICDPLSSQGLHQRQLFHNGRGWCVIVEAHYLQQSSSVSSQKIALTIFFNFRAPFSNTPPQSPMVDTVLVLSQTSDNHYIQICQLEKDKQKRVVVFLPTLSTARQVKSTIWIIHVLLCVDLGGGRVLVWFKSFMTWGGAEACSSSSYFLVDWRYGAVALPPEELLLP